MPRRLLEIFGIGSVSLLPLLSSLGSEAAANPQTTTPSHHQDEGLPNFVLSDDARTMVQPLLDERPLILVTAESSPKNTQLAYQVRHELGETRSALGSTRQRVSAIAETLGRNAPSKIPSPLPDSTVDAGPVESFDTGALPLP